MAHIHTKPGQHDHTASAFIVYIGDDEPKILLHRHKKLNILLQFGGHIELDENPWQALTHEILEESGYDMSQLEILQPKSRLKIISKPGLLHPYPLYYVTHPIDENHNHTDIGFGFVTTQTPNNKLASGESEEIKYFTKLQIRSLSAKDIPEDVREACMFIFDEALKNWEVVPANTYT